MPEAIYWGPLFCWQRYQLPGIHDAPARERDAYAHGLGVAVEAR